MNNCVGNTKIRRSIGNQHKKLLCFCNILKQTRILIYISRVHWWHETRRTVRCVTDLVKQQVASAGNIQSRA